MFEIMRTTSTISEWYNYSKDNQINFDPPYQRVSNIWDVSNKQLLIDSILNRLDLPKFYVHYFLEKDNKLNITGQTYAIIDGKQRFLSVFEFMEDKFGLSKDFVCIGNPDLELAGLKYSDISDRYPTIKSEFEKYKLDISLVITDEQERIDELFLRLNEGKQLNNAERRNSITGYFTEKIKSLVVNHEFFNKVSFSDKRYDYFDVCTKLLLLCINENIVSLNKRNLDDLLKNHKEETEENRGKIQLFEESLDTFSSIYKINDKILSSKSYVPIYYLFSRRFNDHDSRIIREFLEEFELVKMENRVSSSSKNPFFLEYDRLNQQGTISKRSLENRLEILTLYFYKYLEVNSLSVHTMIATEAIDINIDE